MNVFHIQKYKDIKAHWLKQEQQCVSLVRKNLNNMCIEFTFCWWTDVNTEYGRFKKEWWWPRWNTKKSLRKPMIMRLFLSNQLSSVWFKQGPRWWLAVGYDIWGGHLLPTCASYGSMTWAPFIPTQYKWRTTWFHFQLQLFICLEELRQIRKEVYSYFLEKGNVGTLQ